MDPLFTINFSNTLSWKNFSLYFNFRWDAGNSSHFIGSDPFGNYHNTATTSGAQLKVAPWSENNPTNEHPRLGYVNTYSYYFWSQRQYLKLKDLSLSYTFDQPWVKKANIQNLRLYLSGTDLFTITGCLVWILKQVVRLLPVLVVAVMEASLLIGHLQLVLI